MLESVGISFLAVDKNSYQQDELSEKIKSYLG